MNDRIEFAGVAQAIVHFFNSNNAEIDTTGLSDEHARIVRAVTAIFYALDFTELHQRNDKSAIISQCYEEARSLLAALVSGNSHPAMAFFAAMKKRGRPKLDIFTRRRIYLALAALRCLVEQGETERAARRKIELALKGLPGALKAHDLENFLNRHDDKAARDAEANVFLPLMTQARLAGKPVSPLELLVMLWSDAGPTRSPNKSQKSPFLKR